MQTYYKKENTLAEVASPEDAVWINLRPPFEHGELDAFAERHSVPLDFLTDSLDVDERSRYERDDNCLLILVNSPFLNDNEKESEAIYITVPIGIVITDDHIITVSSKEDVILQKFIADRVKNFDPADKKLFILQLFEQNVFKFLECLKKLNLKRNLIEQELYDSSRNSELKQLLRIEKSLVYFVNSLSANELLKLKIKRTDILKIADNEYYTDFYEDVIIDNGQALEMSNVYTNILSGTMEAYASIISNNMNIFINRLTIITIILGVATLVASFYGMNVKHIPLQDHPYAFPIIISFAVVLGFAFIAYFNRKA